MISRAFLQADRPSDVTALPFGLQSVDGRIGR